MKLTKIKIIKQKTMREGAVGRGYDAASASGAPTEPAGGYPEPDDYPNYAAYDKELERRWDIAYNRAQEAAGWELVADTNPVVDDAPETRSQEDQEATEIDRVANWQRIKQGLESSRNQSRRDGDDFDMDTGEPVSERGVEICAKKPECATKWLSKTELKEIIKEEMDKEAREQGGRDEMWDIIDRGNVASKKIKKIRELVIDPMYPRNRTGAAKTSLEIIEEIKNILDADEASAQSDVVADPNRPAHAGVFATMPDGSIVQAKGKQ